VFGADFRTRWCPNGKQYVSELQQQRRQLPIHFENFSSAESQHPKPYIQNRFYYLERLRFLRPPLAFAGHFPETPSFFPVALKPFALTISRRRNFKIRPDVLISHLSA
jgi:hypothetical protein